MILLFVIGRIAHIHQQTLWEGYIDITIGYGIKFGIGIKKVRGTTPSPSQTKIIRIMSVLS